MTVALLRGGSGRFNSRRAFVIATQHTFGVETDGKQTNRPQGKAFQALALPAMKERKQSLGGFEIALKQLLLTSVAALLMATSATHARPEFSKTQSWKLTLGTWCVGNHPSDDEAYFGIARDQCG